MIAVNILKLDKKNDLAGNNLSSDFKKIQIYRLGLSSLAP